MAEEVGLINGQRAASTWEWRAAVALWRWHWTFDYQVSFFGGRSLKGGQVVDFMVHTMPLPTPLYVYGEHWHGGLKEAEDVLARSTLWSELGGRVNQPQVLDQRHLLDQDTANQAIYLMFGDGPGFLMID